jgi:hypothetical protein
VHDEDLAIPDTSENVVFFRPAIVGTAIEPNNGVSAARALPAMAFAADDAARISQVSVLTLANTLKEKTADAAPAGTALVSKIGKYWPTR